MASVITPESPSATEEDMILDSTNLEENGGEKRQREEQTETETETKKQKVKEEEVEDKSVEEVRMERIVDKENVEPVGLGPKSFGSSVEMFDYFYKLLHCWPLNISLNKYESLVVLDLIKKGHPEQDQKISSRITAIEIRSHPMWKSRCFFVVRDDKSSEDFSFRKCVDHILLLPENMKAKPDVNKVLGQGKGKKGGGGGGKAGGGHGGGRGRGGRS